jgi:hypothetical protein
LSQCEVSGLFDRPAEVSRVRERRDVDAAHQRTETGPELGPGGRHRGGSDGAAVEAAVEHDHVGAAGCLPAEPEGRLDRFTAGVREEHPVETLGEYFT